MPALHVRNLDDAVVSALKARAAKNHRSLQGEVKSILESAVSHEPGGRVSGRRRLRLHTVRIGRPTSFSREVIYDDDGR